MSGGVAVAPSNAPMTEDDSKSLLLRTDSLPPDADFQSYDVYDEYVLDEKAAKVIAEDQERSLPLRQFAKKHTELLHTCASACLSLQERFDSEMKHLVQSQEDNGENANKTAFGISLLGCKVESLVPGVPAAKVLKPGDEIIEVDGVRVNTRTLPQALVGCDEPGTTVKITFLPHTPETTLIGAVPKPISDASNYLPRTVNQALGKALSSQDTVVNRLQTVELRRIPKELLHDRKVMMEYLRSLKVMALERDDQRASEILDKIKQLMEQMLPSSDDANSKYTLASKLVKYSVGVVQDLSSCLEAIKGMDKLEPYVKQLEHLIKQPPVLLARLDRAHKELARVKQLHDKVDVLLDLDKDTVSDPEAMKASMDLVATMMHKLDMAGHRKKELEATCASRLEDLEHAHTDIQHLKVTVQDLQESISPLLKDIEHWKNLLAGTRKDLDVAQQDLRAAEARSAALAGERTELREMLTSLTEQKDDLIAGLRIELNGLKRVNAQQEEDMALAEAKHRASLDELADQVSDLKRLLAEEKTSVQQLDHKFAKSTKEIEELRAKHESERESWKASVEEVKQRLLDAKTRGDDAHRLHQSALVQKEALETKLALQGQGLLQQREAAVAKEKEFKDDKAQSAMQIDTLEHKLAAALKEIDELNTRLVAQADEFKTDQEQLQDKLAASVERARWEESEKKKWLDGHAKQQALVEEKQTDIQDLKNRLADLALKHAEELAASKASTEEVRRERETLRLEQGETAARLKDTQEALDKLRSDMEAQASKHTEALTHAGDLHALRLAETRYSATKDKEALSQAAAEEKASLMQRAASEKEARDTAIKQKEIELKSKEEELAGARLKLAVESKRLVETKKELGEVKLTVEALRSELQTAKEALDDSLKSQDVSKKEMLESIAELRRQLSDTTIRANNEESGKLHWMAEKKATDNDVEAKAETIASLQKAIEDHTARVQELKNEVATRDTTLKTRDASISHLQAQIASKEKESEVLTEKVKEMENQLAKEREHHVAELAPKDSQIAELRGWLDDASARNTALTRDKNALEDEVKQGERRLEQALRIEADLRERKMPVLDNEVKKLQVVVQRKDDEITELKRRLDSVLKEMGKQIAQLEKDVSVKTTQLQAQQETIDSLQQQLSNLKKQLEAANEAIRDKDQTNTALQREVGALKTSNKQLHADIEELKNTLNAANKALAEVEGRLARSQMEYTRLQAEHERCPKLDPQCGIGMMLHDDVDDYGKSVVRMKQSVLGGSVWREQVLLRPLCSSVLP